MAADVVFMSYLMVGFGQLMSLFCCFVLEEPTFLTLCFHFAENLYNSSHYLLIIKNDTSKPAETETVPNSNDSSHPKVNQG